MLSKSFIVYYKSKIFIWVCVWFQTADLTSQLDDLQTRNEDSLLEIEALKAEEKQLKEFKQKSEEDVSLSFYLASYVLGAKL